MKLLHFTLAQVAQLALSQEYHQVDFGLKEGGAEQLFSIFIGNFAADRVTEILSHGCWCTILDSENFDRQELLGGKTLTDDLDAICKDWQKARHCSESCEITVANPIMCEREHYDLTVGAGNFLGTANCNVTGQNATDCAVASQDLCLLDSCAIDVHYLGLVFQFLEDFPKWEPVVETSCQERDHSGAKCADYSEVTQAPITFPIGETEAFTVPPQAAAVDQVLEQTGGTTCRGPGSICVTIMWENDPLNRYSDFDIWVTEPSGEQIGYSNMRSATGGFLDVDMLGIDYSLYSQDQTVEERIELVSVENVVWESGAPSGTYTIEVHNYQTNVRNANGGFDYVYADYGGGHPFDGQFIPVNLVLTFDGLYAQREYHFDLEMPYPSQSSWLTVHTFDYTNPVNTTQTRTLWDGPPRAFPDKGHTAPAGWHEVAPQE